MKLTVARGELVERLSNIQSVVEKRNTMPVLSHFLLEARASGVSRITATDIETALREPLECSVAEEGVLCIPARKLFEIVKELEGDVTIESEDSQWIKVSAGRSNFRLACLSPDEFPLWPQMEQSSELKLPPAVLVDLIEKTIYSAGESDTRYTLNGLLFNIKEGQLTVVGTDGHRMAVRKMKLESPMTGEHNVIVPRKTVSEVRKFMSGQDGEVSVVISSNHILFSIGDVEFLARLIEGSYPNYTQVIPTKNEKHIVINREGFIKALKRVSVMSRERSNAVKVTIEDAILRLNSNNPDIGEARDEVAIEYSGEGLEAGFNARYILDVVQAMGSEKVVFSMHDQLSPTLLREDGNEEYLCVIMPMRI